MVVEEILCLVAMRAMIVGAITCPAELRGQSPARSLATIAPGRNYK